MNTDMLQVGLIGMGVIAKYYLPAIENTDGINLLAICDRDPQKMISYQERGIQSFTSYHDLISKANVDAVIVNVPNDQHFQICKDAILAGKHICCEKPLTTQLHAAEILVDLAYKNNITLFTAFHRRYNKNIQNMVKQISSLNKITKVTAFYLENIHEHMGNNHWYLHRNKCGGGCIIDNGSNVYDYLSLLLGPIKIVKCYIDWAEDIDIRAKVQLVSHQNVPIEVNLDWAYELGEKKDMVISMQDNINLYVNLLEGFPAFKTSLFHEYQAILVDFKHKVYEGGFHGLDGLTIVKLIDESYNIANSDRFKEGKSEMSL